MIQTNSKPIYPIPGTRGRRGGDHLLGDAFSGTLCHFSGKEEIVEPRSSMKDMAIMSKAFRSTGLRLAGVYSALVAGVWTLTALTTSPGKVGLDWIPLLMLAWPWVALGGQSMLLPGLALNAVACYLVGGLLDWIRLYWGRDT